MTEGGLDFDGLDSDDFDFDDLDSNDLDFDSPYFDDAVIPAGPAGPFNDGGVGGKSSGQDSLVQSMFTPARAVISICLLRY